MASRALLSLNLLALAIGVAYFVYATGSVSAPILCAATLVLFALAIVAVRVVPALRKGLWREHAWDVGTLLAFVTLTAYATGGIRSPLLSMYVMPLGAIALAFWRWWAVVAGAFVEAILLFGLAAVTNGANASSADFWVLIAATLAPGTAVAASLAGLAGQMRKAEQRITDLAATDSVTGLLNLNAFEDLFQQAHAQAERTGRHYTIMSIDVDNVASVNQTLGHEAGTQIIIAVAQALSRSIRGSDIAARLGGDEFVVLLVESDAATAAVVAQRIRNHVYNSTIAVGSRMMRASVSVGTATYPGDHLYSKELMIIANQRMRRERDLRRTSTEQT
jgi:diguanylate cyclase (GGDEF)-like protein